MGCLEILVLAVLGCVLIGLFFFAIEFAVCAVIGIILFGGIGFLIFGATGLKVGIVLGILAGLYWAVAG